MRLSFLLIISLISSTPLIAGQYVNVNVDKETFIKGYIDSRGDIGESSSTFRVYYLPVKKEEQYRIMGRGGPNSIALSYAVYNSEPKDFSRNSIVQSGSIIKNYFFKEDIVITDSTARYLAFTWFKDHNPRLQKYCEVIPRNGLLSGYYSVFSDISSQSFVKQQNCLHHDNFHRVIEGKSWHIGTNDPRWKSMVYSSPRDDYETVDDGFRIVNGVLTNERDVSVDKSFRIIDSYIQLSGESLIEISNVNKRGYTAQVVFNFIDANNYNGLRIKRSFLGYSKIFYLSCINGIEKDALIIKTKNDFGSLRVQFNDKSVRLFLDDISISDLTKGRIETLIDSISIDRGLPIALYVDTEAKYEYSFINLFSIESLISRPIESLFTPSPNEYNYAYSRNHCIIARNFSQNTPALSSYSEGDYYINTEKKEVYIKHNNKWEKSCNLSSGVLIYLTDTNESYIYTSKNTGNGIFELQSKSLWPNSLINNENVIERFELRRCDVTNLNNARSENAEKYVLYNNLRKKIFSFDVFLPIDFANDVSGDESIFQCQLRGDYDNEVRQPSLTIISSIENGKVIWRVNTRSIPSKWSKDENVIRNDNVFLGEARMGEWTHFDIYIKEGYMQGHNPLLIIKINGKESFVSHKPNTWNEAKDCYVRYGVYKSDYSAQYAGSDKSKRVVYFSNFKGFY